MGFVFILKCIGIVFFSVVATISFFIALKILSRQSEYESNKTKTNGVSNAILGRVNTIHNGCRDSSIHAGVVVDKKTNLWVEQGALSDGAIDSVLRR